MEKRNNVTFDEYTRLYTHMNDLHGDTKQEFKQVNNRLDNMETDLTEVKTEIKNFKGEVNNKFDNIETDLKVIKNILLQMVENNGLKVIK